MCDRVCWDVECAWIGGYDRGAPLAVVAHSIKPCPIPCVERYYSISAVAHNIDICPPKSKTRCGMEGVARSFTRDDRGWPAIHSGRCGSSNSGIQMLVGLAADPVRAGQRGVQSSYLEALYWPRKLLSSPNETGYGKIIIDWLKLWWLDPWCCTVACCRCHPV